MSKEIVTQTGLEQKQSITITKILQPEIYLNKHFFFSSFFIPFIYDINVPLSCSPHITCIPVAAT